MIQIAQNVAPGAQLTDVLDFKSTVTFAIVDQHGVVLDATTGKLMAAPANRYLEGM
jgi:hypothetical protein